MRSYCDICGKEKRVPEMACSPLCTAREAQRISWDLINVGDLMKDMTLDQIAVALDVSPDVVMEQAKKRGLQCLK